MGVSVGLRLVGNTGISAPSLVLLLALEVMQMIDGEEQVESSGVIGGAARRFSRSLDRRLGDGRRGRSNEDGARRRAR